MKPPAIRAPSRPLGRIAFMAKFVRNPLEVIPRAAYEEDFVAFGRPQAPRAWVTSPAAIKAVLLDERDKFRKLNTIRLLGPLLRKGILTSEGAEWKWQRQAASPMFRREELVSHVPAFVQAAERVVARWRTSTQPAVHDVDVDMTRATFEVISATLLPAADERFAAAMERSIRALQRFGGWDLLYASLALPGWLPRPGMLRELEAMRVLRSNVGTLLDWAREGKDGPENLMHRLIAARDPETGRGMDDEQLIDNLLTFYLAGHDTTAKALTWTLYLLACSPEWSARLRDEIASVTAGEPVRAEHLDRLVQVQQVLKESMRLYPPVPMMSRQAIDEAIVDGHVVKPGSSIVIPMYAVHRHARRWPTPTISCRSVSSPNARRRSRATSTCPSARGPASASA